MGKSRDRKKGIAAEGKPRRGAAPTEPEGRKASAPLYVMLEPGEKERYEQLAKELDVTMRDLVRMAMAKLLAERNAAALAGGLLEPTGRSLPPERPPTEMPELGKDRRSLLFDYVTGRQAPEMGAISATLHQAERLRRLEDAVARILRHLGYES